MDHGGQAEAKGLKVGDQVLEVNRENFQNISHASAVELLRKSSQLIMRIKVMEILMLTIISPREQCCIHSHTQRQVFKIHGRIHRFRAVFLSHIFCTFVISYVSYILVK